MPTLLLLLLLACTGTLGDSGGGDSADTDTGTDTDTDTGPVDLTGAPIVLVLVDTLRADHLPWAGYHRDTAPVLTEWGEGAAVWPWATSSASNTGPSVASLWTGLHLPAHGMLEHSAGWALDDRHQTLAEVLAEAGYQTSAVLGTQIVSESRGLAQGFGTFTTVDPTGQAIAEDVVDAALAELAVLEATGEPWLLYAHLIDPHDDYGAPEPYTLLWDEGYDSDVTGTDAEVRAWDEGTATPTADDVLRVLALYDGEITYADSHLERLLGAIPDNAVVVFTSDHGEQFGEHGDWFHADEHRENLAIPLAFRVPGGVPGVHPGHARQIDVLPTLCDLVAVECPEHVQGVSLAGTVRDGDPAPELATYTQRGTQWAYQRGTWKLHREASYQLWDHAVDPGETVDVSAGNATTVATLRAEAEALQADSAALLALLLGGS